MHGVAERLLECGDFWFQPLRHPSVDFRHDDVLGEGAGDVDAQDAHVLAYMGAAGAALVARPIDPVRLGRDELAQ